MIGQGTGAAGSMSLFPTAPGQGADSLHRLTRSPFTPGTAALNKVGTLHTIFSAIAFHGMNTSPKMIKVIGFLNMAPERKCLWKVRLYPETFQKTKADRPMVQTPSGTGIASQSGNFGTVFHSPKVPAQCNSCLNEKYQLQNLHKHQAQQQRQEYGGRDLMIHKITHISD